MGQSYFWMFFVFVTILQFFTVFADEGISNQNEGNSVESTTLLTLLAAKPDNNEDKYQFELLLKNYGGYKVDEQEKNNSSDGKTISSWERITPKPVTTTTRPTKIQKPKEDTSPEFNLRSLDISNVLSPVTDMFKPVADIFKPLIGRKHDSSSEEDVNGTEPNPRSFLNMASSMTDMFKPMTDILKPVERQLSELSSKGNANSNKPVSPSNMASPMTDMFKPMTDILKPVKSRLSELSSEGNANSNKPVSPSNMVSSVTDAFKPMTDIFKSDLSPKETVKNIAPPSSDSLPNMMPSVTDAFKPMTDIFNSVTGKKENEDNNKGSPSRKGLLSSMLSIPKNIISKGLSMLTQPAAVSSFATAMLPDLYSGFSAGDVFEPLMKTGGCLLKMGFSILKSIWRFISNFPSIMNILRDLCKIIVGFLSRFAYKLTMGLNCIRNIGRAIKAIFYAIKDFIWSNIKGIFRILTTPMRWIFKAITFIIRCLSNVLDFVGIILDLIKKGICRLFIKPISFLRYILRAIGTYWILDPIRFVKTLIYEVILFPWNKHYGDLFRSEMPLSPCIPGSRHC